MSALKNVTLIGGTVTMGLMAGLFYAYSCSVMLGLGKVDDRTFVDVMQKINVAIINPAFMFCFMGTVVIVGAAAFFNRGSGALKWIIAGLVLYIVALIVTFAFNIPLNDQLAAAGDPARISDLAAVRSHFESDWVRWNLIRAVLHTGSFGLLCWALVVSGNTAT
ncbi:anthrone oxygenase family protein [Antrihabitans cavernicola]|uniref:DUF1772 domain-containing protein n=1 Tax=Antrihabitans cavernicola TaxID=2495913 RepID=A0A5A7S7C0_9NOCA|nr:anthrone oxygenase family protein [Spelaeibacter cavernicola]KAA0022048.1 DUF1772 domain-containing protein [Spelaeibacter cavernicola]